MKDMIKQFSDAEFEQSIIRILLGGVVQLYLTFFASTPTWVSSGFVIFYLISATLALTISILPGHYWWRRIFGQCIDLGATSILLYYYGETGITFFAIYLWVITGNGCRFGVTYLLSATVITVSLFSIVAMNGSFWIENRNVTVGIGISLLIVPVYLSVLLRRLNSAQKQLELLSLHDGLTGLMNRRAFDSQLSTEFSRLKRLPTPFSLMIIDIDHFKAVNDKYGHLAGDAVLKNIAVTLQNNFRSIDVVTRFGGEEFAILLPGHGTTEVNFSTERLRQTVEQLTTEVNGENIKVTISIGVASWNNQYKNTEEWLKHADNALYQAKQKGRNQTVMADSKDSDRPMVGSQRNMAYPSQ